jgi:hypothetical protein
MAEQRDRDELDRDSPMTDEDAQAIGDDEFDEADEGDEEDLEDEEEVEGSERITGEVGSEGGSPGENVGTQEPRKPASGSEATETVKNPR